MQPQSVMGETYFSKKLTKVSRTPIPQHIQDTLIKEVHNKPKYAKIDLKPFLTIFAPSMRVYRRFKGMYLR